MAAQNSSTSTSTSRVQLPDYTQPGPFQAVKLPRLEHTCSRCFPKCTGNKCLLRLSVFYPDKAASMKDGGPQLKACMDLLGIAVTAAMPFLYRVYIPKLTQQVILDASLHLDSPSVLALSGVCSQACSRSHTTQLCCCVCC